MLFSPNGKELEISLVIFSSFKSHIVFSNVCLNFEAFLKYASTEV